MPVTCTGTQRAGPTTVTAAGRGTGAACANSWGASPIPGRAAGGRVSSIPTDGLELGDEKEKLFPGGELLPPSTSQAPCPAQPRSRGTRQPSEAGAGCVPCCEIVPISVNGSAGSATGAFLAEG